MDAFSSSDTIVVIGGGGPTGVECIKRLLQKTDARVCALVRNPAKHEEHLRRAAGGSACRLEVLAADVTKPETLGAVLKGAAGVIYAAAGHGNSYFGTAAVDDEGVGNVAAAAKAAGTVKRVVLVSGMCVHPINRFHPVRAFMNTYRWGLMDNKFKGEEKLRTSGVPYTIVRAPFLHNKPAGQWRIHMDVDAVRECRIFDTQFGPYHICRADVAAVCVKALGSPAAANKTLSVYHAKRAEAARLPAEPHALDAELDRLFTAL